MNHLQYFLTTFLSRNLNILLRNILFLQETEFYKKTTRCQTIFQCIVVKFIYVSYANKTSKTENYLHIRKQKVSYYAYKVVFCF